MAQAPSPDIPNAFVDPSAALITLLNPDGMTLFVLPALFWAYAKYDGDLRNGSMDSTVPVGYDQFAGRWNQDMGCQYRFSTFNVNTASATIVGAPFPARLLNTIDPPPAPCPATPPPSDRYTDGQHDLIQHMLWNTAHCESYFEKKREAARAKKVDDHCSKCEEYRARDAAMGRPCTPQKAPVVPPTAAAEVIPTASVAAVATQSFTAPSIPITGPSSVAGPSTIPALPLVASGASGSSTTAVLPPPCMPSPMQEDEPDLLAHLFGDATTNTARDIENGLTFTEDDLLNFSDDEENTPLASLKSKGKGKDVA